MPSVLCFFPLSYLILFCGFLQTLVFHNKFSYPSTVGSQQMYKTFGEGLFLRLCQLFEETLSEHVFGHFGSQY